MRSGNQTFDDGLAPYQDEIYRYAVRLTLNRAEADALYRETLREAHHAFDRRDGSGRCRAWLFAVATDAFLRDRYRRGRDRSGNAARADARPDAPGSRADRPGARDLVREVQASAAALPRAEWVALVQRAYHDRSYAEIAGSLGCSATAAQASVYAALRALRDHVGDRL